MNSQDDFRIKEIDKLNFNENKILKKKSNKKNNLILIIIEIFLFIVLIILKYNQKVINEETLYYKNK